MAQSRSLKIFYPLSTSKGFVHNGLEVFNSLFLRSNVLVSIWFGSLTRLCRKFCKKKVSRITHGVNGGKSLELASN